MISPTDALQRAMHAALAADSGVAALVGPRIYDRVPSDAASPYLEFGEFQRIDDSVDCIAGSEFYVTLHGWSDAYGSIEAMQLAGAAVDALDRVDLDLAPDHRLVEIMFESERIMDDPNGVTTHAVLVFRALTEPV